MLTGCVCVCVCVCVWVWVCVCVCVCVKSVSEIHAAVISQGVCKGSVSSLRAEDKGSRAAQQLLTRLPRD